MTTDKESGSSTENLLHTPKRIKPVQVGAFSALKKQESTTSHSKKPFSSGVAASGL